MVESTKIYCIFFYNLSPELKESVKYICEQAKRKSTIYSDTITAIDSFSNFYTDKNNISQIIDNFTKQKEILDSVINLYNPKLLLKPLSYRDFFFFRLLQNCIKHGSMSQQYQPEPDYYVSNMAKRFKELYPLPNDGGKRKKGKKTIKNKKSKKSKKSKSITNKINKNIKYINRY